MWSNRSLSLFYFLFKMLLCLADLWLLGIKFWSSASTLIGLSFLGVCDSIKAYITRFRPQSFDALGLTV
jgi:hypothetical protein